MVWPQRSLVNRVSFLANTLTKVSSLHHATFIYQIVSCGSCFVFCTCCFLICPHFLLDVVWYVHLQSHWTTPELSWRGTETPFQWVSSWSRVYGSCQSCKGGGPWKERVSGSERAVQGWSRLLQQSSFPSEAELILLFLAAAELVFSKPSSFAVFKYDQILNPLCKLRKTRFGLFHEGITPSAPNQEKLVSVKI